MVKKLKEFHFFLVEKRISLTDKENWTLIQEMPKPAKHRVTKLQNGPKTKENHQSYNSVNGMTEVIGSLIAFYS